MPVLPHDCAVGRAEDEAQVEGRDYGIVELPRDRHEIGDEVYWRREPQARDSNDDLRAKRDARVAQQPSKHPHEIRNQQCKFAREQHAAGASPVSGAIYGGFGETPTEEADALIRAVMTDLLDAMQAVPAP